MGSSLEVWMYNDFRGRLVGLSLNRDMKYYIKIYLFGGWEFIPIRIFFTLTFAHLLNPG